MPDRRTTKSARKLVSEPETVELTDTDAQLLRRVSMGLRVKPKNIARLVGAQLLSSTNSRLVDLTKTGRESLRAYEEMMRVQREERAKAKAKGPRVDAATAGRERVLSKFQPFKRHST